MTTWQVVVAVVATYLAACVALGLMPGRRQSASATGYVAGDRTLGLLVMYFVTGASVFSAFAFLGAPGWAYGRGMAVLYILGFGTFGMLPMYVLGPRAARLGRQHGYVTQAEMVADRLRSPGLAGVMAVVSVVAFVPYLALQMKGAGIVLEVVTEGRVPPAVGAAVVYGVVTLYVLRSGVLGVGWTNTFQGVFMILLAWALGLYLPAHLYGGVGEMFEELERQRPELLVGPGLDATGAPWSWSEYGSAIAVSAVGFSFWPHLFMKAFSARDPRTVRRTIALYPTFQLFLVPLILIGFAGVLFEPPPAQPDQVLPHLLMRLEIPALVVGLFCAGALAASMSSGDAMAHAAASIAVRDGVRVYGGRELSPTAERRWIRVAVVIVMLAAYPVAVLYEGSLVTMLLVTYGAVVQFAPAVTTAVLWPRANGAAVLLGMLLGTVVTAWFVVLPDARPWAVHAGAYGLAANVACILLGSWRRPATGAVG